MDRKCAKDRCDNKAGKNMHWLCRKHYDALCPFRQARTNFKSIKSYKHNNKKGKFTLSFEEYTCITSRPCHYCGAMKDPESRGFLDRIDNEKGYQAHNVLPCCGNCNGLRSDKLSVEETLFIVSWLMERRGGQW